MAYEFVEAFSSVVPSIRISKLLAVVGVCLDLLWRIVTGNFIGPAYIDILASLLVGYYLGKRPKNVMTEKDKKSLWTRLS